MILVMAGTSDGKAIALELQQLGFPVLVTVTTAYGEALAAEAGLRVERGPLDREALQGLLQERNIALLVDATHPYAAGASENAMAAAQAAAIPYFRYERPESLAEGNGIAWFDTVDALAEAVGKVSGAVLLTLGSNLLPKFSELPNRDRLHVRILPDSVMVERCRQLGFRGENILAIQGPFSQAFNEALIRQWDIRVLVTKESAGAGGFQEKAEAAQACGIDLYILGRPRIAYQNLYSDPQQLILAVRQACGQIAAL